MQEAKNQVPNCPDDLIPTRSGILGKAEIEFLLAGLFDVGGAVWYKFACLMSVVLMDLE